MVSKNSLEALKVPSKRICKQCGSEYLGVGHSLYCSSVCSSMNQYEANMFKPKWRLNKLAAMAKNRAQAKGLPFNIDTEYLYSLWEENDGCCAILGISLELGRSEKGKVHPYAPSIDRIIPQNGYVRGNVRIIAYQLNVALSEFGLEQFDELVQIYNTACNSGVSFR